MNSRRAGHPPGGTALVDGHSTAHGTLRYAEVALAAIFTLLAGIPAMPVEWRVISGLLTWVLVWDLLAKHWTYLGKVPKDIFWGRLAFFTVWVFIGFANQIERAWKVQEAAVLEGDIFEGTFEPATDCVPLPVQVGSNGATLFMVPHPGTATPPYFAPFQDTNFLVQCGKHGVLVSTIVRDRNGAVVAKIERNHWTVFPPYFSDKNYTNTAFEVKDNSDHVVLQIKFVRGTLQVQGEWWNDEQRGMRVVYTGLEGGEIIPLILHNQHNESLIEPMFQYPSKDYWGEFVKPHLVDAR